MSVHFHVFIKLLQHKSVQSPPFYCVFGGVPHNGGDADHHGRHLNDVLCLTWAMDFEKLATIPCCASFLTTTKFLPNIPRLNFLVEEPIALLLSFFSTSVPST